VESRLRQASAMIDTRGPGVALAVWNMLSWPRSDIAVAEVAFSAGDVRDLGVSGPDGLPVPLQVLSSVRSGDGSLLRAEIAFVARDVPALGYSIYRVIPAAAPPPATSKATDEPVLENDFCRLEFVPASGAMARLVMKPQQYNLLGGAGNVVAREEDHGDVWELYHNLGMGLVANKTPHAAPQRGKAVFSNEQPGITCSVSRGPVFSEFKAASPFGGQSRFATTVRLYAGIRRIDIRTQILNNEKSVRYRLLFPTSIRNGQSFHEIPFGAIQRPAGMELPAQNWVDYGDGEKGLAVLNRGLPGNNVADGTMMVSLLRSTRIQAYGYGGGYEPGMSSDSALELGKELVLDYALVPHAGDWRRAGVYRDGLEFNQPLVARSVASHPGALPKRWGFLEINPRNVIVSALKTGPGRTAVLRIYEPAGQAASARIHFSKGVDAAEEVGLMEDPGRKLALTDTHGLQVHLHPFEIKTIKLRFQAAASQAAPPMGR
jgi:alpha-mannosidase